MANENKPLNEAKPNEPITAQRWNDMQLALRKEHIEHSHNGKWTDGQFSGAPLTSEGLADNAVITARIADGAVTGAKVDSGSDYKVRTLGITGDKLPAKSPALSVDGTAVVTGVLRANPAGKDSLVAGDGYVEAGGGGNPLRLTSLWSGFTETKPNAAEISNDTNTYKALMIVGNRSAGGVRKVALWDRVDVMGRLVVGPGQDAGLTVNGLVDASAIKAVGDLSASTLNVTAQANLAALRVTGAGLQIGGSALQPFNRAQIQSGALHMDGNPIYLRADVSDQYDLIRWNSTTDCVDVAGFHGAALGFTKGGTAPVFTQVLAVRDTLVELLTNGNALRFTSAWSNFPAAGTKFSEISNDISAYKTLMIIGNRSNDPNVRRVSVWDRLEVNGTLAVNGSVTGTLAVTGAIVPSVGNSAGAGIMFPVNPGGGGGDSAFIRYSVETGEATTLRIGIDNDADDALRLYQAGADRLHVQNGRVTVGGVAYTGGEARYLNAEGELKSFGAGAGYRMSDRADANNAARDWVLHVNGQALRFWNGTTGDAAVLTAAGRLTLNKIQLGNKFLLSGDGDVEGNDHWLRLKSVTGGNTPPFTNGYYGGFAAWFLWSWQGVNSGSDRALKRDIAPLESPLDRICRLRGVSFRWKTEGDDRLRVGLVAQEVQEVYPEVVAPGPDGFLGVQYEALVAPLVEAVKEQQQQIAGLRRELAILRSRLL